MPESEAASKSTRVPLSALLCAIAVLAAATALARGGSSALKSVTPVDVWSDESGGENRITDLLTSMPELAQPDRPALVLGSSLIMAGFSPAIFDSAFHETRPQAGDLTSFNIGFARLNPSVQLLLCHRIESTFHDAHRKVSVALVEFTPFQATRARRADNDVARRAILMTPRDFAAEALESPRDAAAIFGFAALGSPPEVVTNVLKRRIYDPPAPAFWPSTPPEEGSSEAIARTNRLRRTLGQKAGEQGGGVGWQSRWRGENRVVFPETKELYAELLELITTPEALERDRQDRVRTTDAVELHFDDQLVDDFIEVVRSFQRMSDHTYIVLAPRNRAWLEPTPAALERLATVMRHIERETGEKVIDLSVATEFEAADFRDTTHLTETTGRPKFSRLLAARVSELLAGGAP